MDELYPETHHTIIVNSILQVKQEEINSNVVSWKESDPSVWSGFRASFFGLF